MIRKKRLAILTTKHLKSSSVLEYHPCKSFSLGPTFSQNRNIGLVVSQVRTSCRFALRKPQTLKLHDWVHVSHVPYSVCCSPAPPGPVCSITSVGVVT